VAPDGAGPNTLEVVKTDELQLKTGTEPSITDITAEVALFCEGEGDGLVSVFVPHATAGVAIFETGAGTGEDVLAAIDRLLPRQSKLWNHEHGTPGHGRDHVLPAFLSPSVTIPVEEGRMLLGTWQSVVLVDTNVDNPYRSVRLTFVSG
jgi:secondary thiamine-phosphate synthase enzyme